MKIALSSLALLAAAAAAVAGPRAAAAQLRGGGAASRVPAGHVQVQDPRAADAGPGASRRLAVGPTHARQYFVQGGSGCTGALVASNVVLTSATCKDGFFGPTAPKSVIVGSARLGEVTDGAERLHVVTNSSVVHPSYDPTTLNANLMLFAIEEAKHNVPIGLQPNIQVFYDEPSPPPADNQMLSTVGFGRATPRGGVAGTDLLGITMIPVWKDDLSSCPATISEKSRSPRGAMCGYSVDYKDESDVCQTSPGAPVMDWDGGLIGIASWDDGCLAEPKSTRGSSMVYSTVGGHWVWLLEGICKLSAAQTYCAPKGGWADGDLCGLGTTCSKCKNPATYWTSKAMTACGTEPCWGYRTICGAGTTCNQCCNGYSWKVEDFFTSCN